MWRIIWGVGVLGYLILTVVTTCPPQLKPRLPAPTAKRLICGPPRDSEYPRRKARPSSERPDISVNLNEGVLHYFGGVLFVPEPGYPTEYFLLVCRHELFESPLVAGSKSTNK